MHLEGHQIIVLIIVAFVLAFLIFAMVDLHNIKERATPPSNQWRRRKNDPL